MKNALMTTVLILGFTSAASAASAQKICFGMGDAKGEHMLITATKTKVLIEKAVGDNIGEAKGAYEKDGEVKARDGKKYISYNVELNEEGVALLVDEALLKKGTKGYAKLRWRAEGFTETDYFCKDAK